MKTDMTKFEKIIDKHKRHLVSINNEIFEGILEGVKEGIAEGLKRAVKDGLKECFADGSVSIDQDDIKDIFEDIHEEFIRHSVKEGTKYIFEKSTEVYVDRVCKELVDNIQEEDIKLPKDHIGYVLDLVNICEQEIAKKTMRRLPNNYFFREVMSGMQTALQECLEEKFRAWEKKIQEEVESDS